MNEMVFRMGQVLQEMTGSDSSANSWFSDHHKKIKAMDKD
jgi:hypothetical protein